MFMLGLIIGLWIGCMVGVIIAGLLHAAKDNWEEKQ